MNGLCVTSNICVCQENTATQVLAQGLGLSVAFQLQSSAQLASSAGPSGGFCQSSFDLSNLNYSVSSAKL